MFSAVHCIVVHCVVVASGEEPVAMACRAMDLASFSHASQLLPQLQTSHTIVAHCYGLAPFSAPAAVPSSSVVSVAQDRILSCGGGRLGMRGSTRKQGSTGTRSVAKSNSRTCLSLRNLFTESESTVNFLPPAFPSSCGPSLEFPGCMFSFFWSRSFCCLCLWDVLNPNFVPAAKAGPVRRRRFHDASRRFGCGGS